MYGLGESADVDAVLVCEAVAEFEGVMEGVVELLPVAVGLMP